jgi:aldehyde dehydrogenase (NAD+)
MGQYSVRDNWQSLAAKRRCRIVAGVAAKITEAAEELTQLCASDQRTDPLETIAAELLPLCSGLRFIGRRGAKILGAKRYGMLGRPVWLWGVSSVVRRDPHGKVLILGTWNYPLLLVGAQASQALAAGNEVLIKPAIGSEEVTARMVQAFHDAGIPESYLQQIDSSTESAVAAIDAGVDLIVLTGAASTGRKVLQQAAQSLTPTIMELSGCDAVIIMPGANIERAAIAIDFGLNFNGGATCISPRRLVIEESMADRLGEALRRRLGPKTAHIVHPAARQATAESIERAISEGAVDRWQSFDSSVLRTTGHMKPLVLDQVRPEHSIASADLFAPVTSIIRVDQIADAQSIVNDCRYRLAASVFGPASEAEMLAAKLKVGSVAINDLLVPTADPRLPFGGRGDSGFGVTRGAEGLLAMTVPTVISRRRGRFAPHLDPQPAISAQALIGALQLLHAGSLGQRLHGLRQLLAARD